MVCWKLSGVVHPKVSGAGCTERERANCAEQERARNSTRPSSQPPLEAKPIDKLEPGLDISAANTELHSRRGFGGKDERWCSDLYSL